MKTTTFYANYRLNLALAGPTHQLLHKQAKLAASIASLSTAAAANNDLPVLEGGVQTYIKDPSFPYTGPLRPVYPLSEKRIVPSHIPRPDYADHPKGESQCEIDEAMRNRNGLNIKIHTPEEIEGMREVCKLARKVLTIAAAAIKPGVTTDEIDAIVHAECLKRDAYPSPLNYRKFPKSVCTSVNEVICHGIPDQRPLQEGDIVNLDVTLYYKGYHGDVNATYPVGQVDETSQKLIDTTKEATMKAIAACKPGVPYSEIGNVIESVAKPAGFSIVRQYTGHGINNLFHCGPNVLHYGKNKMPGFMKEGHIFTIEPMINTGVQSLIHWDDDWTAVTKDGKRSAQFEETILITATGAEILTGPIKRKR